MRKNGVKKDLLDILLELRDEDGWKPQDEDIVDMMIGYVLAGHEATANGMIYVVNYISYTKSTYLEKSKGK
jgi:ent-kaurenoic acid hydroxylase